MLDLCLFWSFLSVGFVVPQGQTSCCMEDSIVGSGKIRFTNLGMHIDPQVVQITPHLGGVGRGPSDYLSAGSAKYSIFM